MFKNKEIKLKEDILNKTEEAFEQLYKEYSKLVFYFTYSMTGNRRDGEDLLQEVFLKVYVNINDYNPYKSSFKTWLVTITRNHVIDFLKQKKDVVYDNEFIENVIDNTIFSERIEYCIRNLNKNGKTLIK